GERLMRPGRRGGRGDGSGYATGRSGRVLGSGAVGAVGAAGLILAVSEFDPVGGGHYGGRLVGTVHVRGSMVQGIGFPRFPRKRRLEAVPRGVKDRKSTRLNSSHGSISYA